MHIYKVFYIFPDCFLLARKMKFNKIMLRPIVLIVWQF